jgi:hypothetical protein
LVGDGGVGESGGGEKGEEGGRRGVLDEGIKLCGADGDEDLGGGYNLHLIINVIKYAITVKINFQDF